MNRKLEKTYIRVKKDFKKRYFKFMENAIKNGEVDDPDDWRAHRDEYANGAFQRAFETVCDKFLELQPDLKSARDSLKVDDKFLAAFDDACLLTLFRMTRAFIKQVLP